jgi:hypothetical protein
MTALNDGPSLPPELALSVERYAVYRCFSDGGQLLYVGESGELGKRLAAHAGKLWFTEVRGITLEWYADELDALNAERRAIHVEHPKYNVVHRNSATPAPSVPRARSTRKPSRRSALTLEERARAALAAEPSLNGSQLGLRIGVSESYGRKLRAFVVDGVPIPGQKRSPK